MSIDTPWGVADTVRVVALGIIWYSTSSHGGYGIDQERWAELRQVLPGFQPWAGDGWLEEDCDWVAAVAVWPWLFDDWHCVVAVRSLLTYRTDIDVSYWKTKSGGELLAKALKETK